MLLRSLQNCWWIGRPSIFSDRICALTCISAASRWASSGLLCEYWQSWWPALPTCSYTDVPPITCHEQARFYVGNKKRSNRWGDSGYGMTLPVYMLQETLFSPLLKQLWHQHLKKQKTPSAPYCKQDCFAVIKRCTAWCVIYNSTGKKLHMGSVGSLINRGGNSTAVVPVTAVSKDHGSVL